MTPRIRWGAMRAVSAAAEALLIHFPKHMIGAGTNDRGFEDGKHNATQRPRQLGKMAAVSGTSPARRSRIHAKHPSQRTEDIIAETSLRDPKLRCSEGCIIVHKSLILSALWRLSERRCQPVGEAASHIEGHNQLS